MDEGRLLTFKEWLQYTIGESETDVVKEIQGAGYSYRVASRDGRPNVGTREYRGDRANLHIVDGKVVKATVG